MGIDRQRAVLLGLTVLDKRRWNPDARGYALVGLALMGDTTRLDDVIRHAKGPEQVERQASLALGLLGDRDDVRGLTRYFRRDWHQKANHAVSNAAFGFNWMRDGRAVAGLTGLARHANARVRAMAVVALGYLAAGDRVSPLSRCYANTSFRNRFAGWDLLDEISKIL